MIIGRKNLVLYVRKRIEKWEEQRVPELMQEGNIETLMKIVEQEDYTPFKRKNEPEFTLDELQIRTAEDVQAITLYVWGNPFVIGGDTCFFKDICDLQDLLRLTCGEWGNDLANALVSTNPYIILSKRAWEGCHALSIEEVLFPDMLKSVS